MSGIVGLWNRDGRPVDDAILCRMRERLSHRTGVQCLALPRAGGDPALVLDGRLDNRDELIDLLRWRWDGGSKVQDPPYVPTDASLVLAAYRSWGEDAPARLVGDFAFGLFDPGRQVLLLARDALGVRPLHYYVSPTLCLWASEIKAIVAHPDVSTRPNDDVVADYLFNLLAADDQRGETFFDNIFSVRPAHVVRVSRDGLVPRQYWDFDPARRLPIRSADEAAEAFREHFTRAVRRRLRSDGPVAVSVSGGLDSSAIFCIAEQLRREAGVGAPTLLGLSYTSPDGHPSDEKTFLADIERHCGARVEQLADLPAGVVDGGEVGVWHLEAPLLEPRWTGTLAYYAAMRDRGAVSVLTGHWGDQILVDVGFFIDLIRRRRWMTAWRSFQIYRQWRDEGVGDAGRRIVNGMVRESLPVPLLDVARRLRARLGTGDGQAEWYSERFRRRGALARGRRAPDVRVGSVHARGLYRIARSRYLVLCMEWQNKVAAMHGMDAAFPFLDRDLIAFLMALPGDLVTAHGVPKGILRRALRDTLPPSIAARTTKANFDADVNAGTAQDYDRLVARVEKGRHAAFHGYENPGALRHIVRPSRDAGECTLSLALVNRLSLELWLEQFFGRSMEASHHA